MQQEDWDALRAQMDSPWGQMKLQCDQFELTLVQAVSSKSKSWSTTVYVDGELRGTWCQAENGEPKHEQTRRFLRKVSRAVNTKKQIEDWRKVFGKRESDKLAAQKYVYFLPDWSSFNSLKKHLVANNTSIQRIH